MDEVPLDPSRRRRDAEFAVWSNPQIAQGLGTRRNVYYGSKTAWLPCIPFRATFKVWDFGFRVWRFAFRASRLGVGGWGLGCMVQGLGIRVEGLGCKV